MAGPQGWLVVVCEAPSLSLAAALPRHCDCTAMATWRVDVSNSRAVRMRNYPAETAELLEEAYDDDGEAASVSISRNGADYRIFWDPENGSWKQERVDDPTRWRYVERFVPKRSSAAPSTPRKTPRIAAAAGTGVRPAANAAVGSARRAVDVTDDEEAEPVPEAREPEPASTAGPSENSEEEGATQPSVRRDEPPAVASEASASCEEAAATQQVARASVPLVVEDEPPTQLASAPPSASGASALLSASGSQDGPPSASGAYEAAGNETPVSVLLKRMKLREYTYVFQRNGFTSVRWLRGMGAAELHAVLTEDVRMKPGHVIKFEKLLAEYSVDLAQLEEAALAVPPLSHALTDGSRARADDDAAHDDDDADSDETREEW
jgi:hypothetical protein